MTTVQLAPTFLPTNVQDYVNVFLTRDLTHGNVVSAIMRLVYFFETDYKVQVALDFHFDEKHGRYVCTPDVIRLPGYVKPADTKAYSGLFGYLNYLGDLLVKTEKATGHRPTKLIAKFEVQSF